MIRKSFLCLWAPGLLFSRVWERSGACFASRAHSACRDFQENELGVTAQLKKLLQSCAGAAAAFLCDVSLGFVMDFS